jgi:DNA-binding transcriptional MerR regulator/GGDEF domain-containing protein
VFVFGLQEVSMEERNSIEKSVEDYLQEYETQVHIRETMQRVRAETTVTIGRAANLFGFTENQLRDWEERELLRPTRHANGQRHYSYADLDKLAIIRALIDARYSPSAIPPDIEDMWKKIALPSPQQHLLSLSANNEQKANFERRLEQNLQLNFWRYYIPRILRLALSLVTENKNTVAGIVLPHTYPTISLLGLKSEDISKVGMSLFGWSGQNGYFTTFLDPSPAFEYHTDFKIVSIQDEKTFPDERTLIVVERQMQTMNLTSEVVATIHRLLEPIYTSFDEWSPAFSQSMYDVWLPVPNFQRDIYAPDVLFNKFADTIVMLGGMDDEGLPRWHNSCILLAKDSLLPLDQRALVIRAISQNAPEKLGETFYSADLHHFSVRAFQSSHVLYQRGTSYRENGSGEEHARLAMPIGSEGGQPLGVLYISGNVPDAFNENDLRVLRLVSRVLEDLLKGDAIGKQIVRNLSECIVKPEVIDRSFIDFGSESEFVQDFENLLADIKEGRIDIVDDTVLEEGKDATPGDEKWVSCVAIDVDKLGSLANKYGDLVVRNLCREVGLRIQGQFHALIRKPDTCKIYHVYRDRFYILMKGIGSKQSLEDAQRLHDALRRPYRINGTRVYLEEATLPEGMVDLYNITARLSVTSYQYEKLLDIINRYLQEYPLAGAIREVRKKVTSSFNDVLKMAMDVGGDTVLSWDHEAKIFKKNEKISENKEEASLQNKVM